MTECIILSAYMILLNCARCYEIDWKSRVIAVADDYVVLDKPAATSVCFSFPSFFLFFGAGTFMGSKFIRPHIS